MVELDYTAAEVSSEKRDTVAFFAIVAALLAIMVVTGLTVGLSGIGVIAVCEAASMLVICILLTAG
jgi:hypothetical protein